MTPELEELVRLYAAALDSADAGKKRALEVFRKRCEEVAEQRKLRVEAVFRFALNTYNKQTGAEDRRVGR